MSNHTISNLTGKWISLEPINESHRADLSHQAQDSQIWTYNANNGYGDEFNTWFDKALSSLTKGEQIPFVVRHNATQQLIGSTRFYELALDNARATVGYTWYAVNHWGSYVNPECKLLLLQHAFENMHLNRVQFVTDARNLRSRAAIIKLGAKEEGMLRQHIIMYDGFVRDSVVFSIVKPEWEAVKNKLQQRLQQFDKGKNQAFA